MLMTGSEMYLIQVQCKGSVRVVKLYFYVCLWWTKWQWDSFFFPSTCSFPPLVLFY